MDEVALPRSFTEQEVKDMTPDEAHPAVARGFLTFPRMQRLLVGPPLTNKGLLCRLLAAETEAATKAKTAAGTEAPKAVKRKTEAPKAAERGKRVSADDRAGIRVLGGDRVGAAGTSSRPRLFRCFGDRKSRRKSTAGLWGRGRFYFRAGSRGGSP